MYTVQKTIELNKKLITIYYSPDQEYATWTTDETKAKQFNTEQEAENIANIGKSTIREKQ